MKIFKEIFYVVIDNIYTVSSELYTHGLQRSILHALRCTIRTVSHVRSSSIIKADQSNSIVLAVERPSPPVQSLRSPCIEVVGSIFS